VTEGELVSQRILPHPNPPQYGEGTKTSAPRTSPPNWGRHLFICPSWGRCHEVTEGELVSQRTLPHLSPPQYGKGTKISTYVGKTLFDIP